MGLWNPARRDRRAPASAKAASEMTLESSIEVKPTVPVHECPEEQAGYGDEEHVSAADDRRGQDGQGLEIDPERQREPQEVVRDTGHERVRDQQVEGPHQVLSMTAPHSQVGGLGLAVARRRAWAWAVPGSCGADAPASEVCAVVVYKGNAKAPTDEHRQAVPWQRPSLKPGPQPWSLGHVATRASRMWWTMW